MPSDTKKWTLGARALSENLAKEFKEALQKHTEDFVSQETRQIVEEEDLKICLLDLYQKLARHEIRLPAGKLTGKELLNSLKIIRKQMKLNNK